MTNNRIFNKNKVDMTKKFNKLFKGDIDMTNKVNYIRKSAKYIIGAAILATGLSSVAFGLEKDNDGYYLIRNKAELKEFADKVNNGECTANAKLMENIVFNGGSVLDKEGNLKGGDLEEFTPIGTNIRFEGEFIGDNKTITGVYINKENNDNQGLFGVIGEGGKVGNIELENSYIRGQKFVGGIAGYNKGTIENCIISGYSAIVGDDYVGGNVGWNEGTIAGKCENSGVVIGKEDGVGGNVGWNEGMIERCNNVGNVKGGYYVGGNVGKSITENAKIGNCINLGIIEGKNLVGGNVGCNDGTITGECENSGEVEGRENIGGNVGWNEGTMEGACDNTGVVTGKEYNVGGNVGWNKGTISNYCINCAERIEGSRSVGGNIGSNSGSIICDNLDEYDVLLVCINDENKIGEVKGNSAVGGNVGWNSGTIEAKKGGVCINEEKVTGKEYDVGGNVGRNDGTITGECGNKGEVTGQDRVGENIGLNFNTKISENNLMNSGTVNGESADKVKEIGKSEN